MVRTFRFEKEGVQGLHEALADEDPKVRQMAAVLLGQTATAAHIEGLVDALHDPDKQVRACAVEGLVGIGARGVPALIAALNDEQWVVRYRAAEALGRIGDEAGLSSLEHALGDEKDHVRYMAAKGLERYARPSSVDVLASCLEDENEYVRTRAVRTLGAIGGARVYALLRARLTKEQHPEVRKAIARALPPGSS
ncbi:MAG TPA: HEAT repeat domain-containing protein [Methanoculleus sp.]|nr:HEAT repeat domain-containing protein [Methanoculleus sp.]